jgi:hypothetical protein
MDGPERGAAAAGRCQDAHRAAERTLERIDLDSERRQGRQRGMRGGNDCARGGPIAVGLPGLAPRRPASGPGGRVQWMLDAVVMVWLGCSAVVAASLLSTDAGD